MFGYVLESQPVHGIPEGVLDRLVTMQTEIEELRSLLRVKTSFIEVLKSAVDERDQVIAALRQR